METELYSVLSRGRPNELHVVGDRRQRLGVIPPLWAAWRGLWLSLAVIVLVLGTGLMLAPGLFGTLWAGLLFLATLEGAAIERLEYRLRGWREVGLVEARSDEGAEELYLTGQAVA